MSCTRVCDSPQSADPIRKITIDAWNSRLRPYWSPSLPHSGVEAVVASRYAVITQEMWFSPPRSPTIVGRAVDTMVWSSAASRMPSISAAYTSTSPPRGVTTRAGRDHPGLGHTGLCFTRRRTSTAPGGPGARLI